MNDPILDDVPSFEEEETSEYNFDDDSADQETTWEWDGEGWRRVT